MTQSTQLTATSNSSSGSNNNSAVTLLQQQQHNSSATADYHHNRLGNGSIANRSPGGKGYTNGNLSRSSNGFPPGPPSTGRFLPPSSSVPTPPSGGGRSSTTASTRHQDYSRSQQHQGVRMRGERDAPAGGGGGGEQRPRDTRRGERDPRDHHHYHQQQQRRSDRWSYYGDPRVRSDQHFLRDTRDSDQRSSTGGVGFKESGRPRGDDRNRHHQGHRDDRNRPRDDRGERRGDHRDSSGRHNRASSDTGGGDRERNRDRYPAGGDDDNDDDDRDRKENRDPEIEGGRESENSVFFPQEEGRDASSSSGDRIDSVVGGDLEEKPETGAVDSERQNAGSETLDERKDTSHHHHHQVSRDRDRSRDRSGDRDRPGPRDHHRSSRGRDSSYERRRRREYDRERDRSYERERERDRDLGRDRDHQPLRREPVGEETGYDSDHSRVSRSTAMSYSTRSLGRRPRSDSVASHASMASHVSGRPPPIPSRPPRGGRGYEEGYSSRELYDQYHYYYQYYRDHPYYKEYYRQWMKQYGHAYPSHESFYDDSTSIHSGRSSVNDEQKKSISSPRAAYDPYGYYYGHTTQPPHSSSQFVQDFHGRSSVGPYEPSAIYPDGSYCQLKSYASGELSGVPSVGGDSSCEAPQRLTPVQYGRPHINARFTPGGQLLFVLPKDPRDGEKAVVQLRDVQKLLCMDPSLNRSVRQMKNYPGPLTLSDTHKDVVVRYCEQQAAEASKNQALPDGESVTLIWEYLALLVKQNGKLYGSDVAGLLLKGQDKGLEPQQVGTSQPTPDDVTEASSSDGSPQDEGIDMQSQSTPISPPRDESVLLKKFTEYLCLGRKKEAVDYAMREGLWGHALALSYKMDSTTHTRVLAAFSSSIPRNDVLTTLFQQLSGKKPEVAKNYTPHQWGNWRQHLAMMVSNPTGQSQRDKASIVALGETLASRGQIHAAHFCYLVAEADWGCFSNKESKLVLIGSTHHLPFQAFATNEAIQCTEIFEFARSLDTSNPLLETFQSYKLIYALRLAEFGFPSEALRYCEVISQIVKRNPQAYQGDFLSQVYELGLRLKYHDLHYQMYEGEIAEIPDPQWLTDLGAVVSSIRQQEAEQAASQAVQEQHHSSHNTGYPSTDTYQVSSSTPDLYPTAGKSASDAYQFGYATGDTAHQQQGHGTPDPYQGHIVTGDVMDGAYTQHQIQSYPTVPETSEQEIHAPVVQTDVSQNSGNASLPQESASPQPDNVPMMMQPQQNQSQYGNYWPGYMPQDTSTSSSYLQPDSAEPSHSSLPASPEVGNEQHSSNVASMSQPSSLNSYQPYQHPYQGYDQPLQQQQQQQEGLNNSVVDQPQSRSPEPAAPQRTPEEEAYWAEMTGKKASNDTAETTSKEKAKTEEKKDPDPSQEKGSGWLGYLFGRKKSKQAVLPDDKNPAIVWNEEKKMWEDKDGGGEVSAPPPPPPKFAAVGPGAPPPMTMSRAGARKSRYVNTEKDASKPPPNGPNPMIPPMLGGPPGIPPMPSGSPVPGGPPLPPGGPMVPSGAPTPPMFMVPGPASQQQHEGDNSSSLQTSNMQQQQSEQHQPLPQLPPTSLPDSSLGTSNDGAEGAVPMMAPPGQPQFFNPTQFNPTPSAPNPAQTTRRVGPGKRLYQGKR